VPTETQPCLYNPRIPGGSQCLRRLKLACITRESQCLRRLKLACITRESQKDPNACGDLSLFEDERLLITTYRLRRKMITTCYHRLYEESESTSFQRQRLKIKRESSGIGSKIRSLFATVHAIFRDD
jgi:hypothetical protein